MDICWLSPWKRDVIG